MNKKITSKIDQLPLIKKEAKKLLNKVENEGWTVSTNTNTLAFISRIISGDMEGINGK